MVFFYHALAEIWSSSPSLICNTFNQIKIIIRFGLEADRLSPIICHRNPRLLTEGNKNNIWRRANSYIKRYFCHPFHLLFCTPLQEFPVHLQQEHTHNMDGWCTSGSNVWHRRASNICVFTIAYRKSPFQKGNKEWIYFKLNSIQIDEVSLEGHNGSKWRICSKQKNGFWKHYCLAN